jgi:hypothetical protein
MQVGFLWQVLAIYSSMLSLRTQTDPENVTVGPENGNDPTGTFP